MQYEERWIVIAERACTFAERAGGIVEMFVQHRIRRDERRDQTTDVIVTQIANVCAAVIPEFFERTQGKKRGDA